MMLRLLGAALVALLLLPLLGLVVGTSPLDVLEALREPATLAALAVSLRTTAVAMGVIVGLGTPLAWWLSRGHTPVRRAVLVAVELPVVLPPAVLGVALLETFGRAGWLGPLLTAFGVQIPFTAVAVVLAQILVGAPLFVLTATAAFREADDDVLLVARTLGASPLRAWWTVALPIAAPGVASGVALAWARALGEFGATLMFAGSLSGRTQTLPLAIYQALDQDLATARAISVLLLAVALGLLVGVRVTSAGPALADQLGLKTNR